MESRLYVSRILQQQTQDRSDRWFLFCPNRCNLKRVGVQLRITSASAVLHVVERTRLPDKRARDYLEPVDRREFDDAIVDSKRGLKDFCLRTSLEWLLSVRDTWALSRESRGNCARIPRRRRVGCFLLPVVSVIRSQRAGSWAVVVVRSSVITDRRIRKTEAPSSPRQLTENMCMYSRQPSFVT